MEIAIGAAHNVRQKCVGVRVYRFVQSEKKRFVSDLFTLCTNKQLHVYNKTVNMFF